MRKISPKGRDLIAEYEQGPGGGPALLAYLCPAGKWTIGYGHIAGVKQGDTLPSKVAAEMLLDDDLADFGSQVDRLIGDAQTSQHEFDALASLAFNIGIGGLAGSTPLRLHKAGKKQDAARSFALWNKATVKGQLQALPGLTRRRAAETALYLGPDSIGGVERMAPMPQEVEPPKTAMQSKTVIAGGVSVAAGAATVADQINQVTPIIESITTVGASLQNVLKLGALALSVIALAAVAYMLFRYIQKRRNGDVIST